MRNGIVGWLAIAVALAACEAETETDLVTQATEPVALAETDLVDLGGTPAMVVTVGATGVNGRLTSWKVSTPAIAPGALQDSALIAGTHHQLHVLTPIVTPKLTRELLVSASISAGTLWVRTWRVADDGGFTQLAVLGYGTVSVLDYAIGHRQILGGTKKFQLVTPVVRAGGNLRLVTWEIDGTTGAITAKADSGDQVTGVAGDPQLSVATVAGSSKLRSHYAVSFLNALGQIGNALWSVDDKGTPTLRGKYASGNDIANKVPVTRSAASLANAALTASGFVTVGDASASPSLGNGEVQVWEDYQKPGGTTITPLNITDSSRDTLPATPDVQQAAAPLLTAPRATVRDPVYDSDLFTLSPDSQTAIASVRKVMILILALDAVAAGTRSLDDVVTVSDDAATSSGNGMGLVAQEQITLRDLLYGMMTPSASDAAWAVSEHIAGSLDNMVTLMNAKASELGLANTVYCHDAGSGFSSVGYSTARDQAALWASRYDDALFIDFTGQSALSVCGTLPDSSQKCHPLSKSMTFYLELDGWKNGNNGGSCAAYAALPGCSECQTTQATRLGRALVVNGARASGTGALTSDATLMLDYGYRQLFTPDWRGDSVTQATTDFGLDAVSDTHTLTAVLPGGTTLRVCNWAVNVGGGLVAKTTCTDRAIAGLTAGGTPATPRRLAIVPVSTLEAEADYLVGRVTAGALKLTAWRVGQKNF